MPNANDGMEILKCEFQKMRRPVVYLQGCTNDGDKMDSGSIDAIDIVKRERNHEPLHGRVSLHVVFDDGNEWIFDIRK